MVSTREDIQRLRAKFNQAAEHAMAFFPHVSIQEKRQLLEAMKRRSMLRLMDSSVLRRWGHIVFSDEPLNEGNKELRREILNALKSSGFERTDADESSFIFFMEKAFEQAAFDPDFKISEYMQDAFHDAGFINQDIVLRWFERLEKIERDAGNDAYYGPYAQHNAVHGGVVQDSAIITHWIDTRIEKGISAENFGGALYLAHLGVSKGILKDEQKITSWLNEALDRLEDKILATNEEYFYSNGVDLVHSAMRAGLLKDKTTVKKWVALNDPDDEEAVDYFMKHRLELAYHALDVGVFTGLDEIFEPEELLHISKVTFSEAVSEMEKVELSLGRY